MQVAARTRPSSVRGPQCANASVNGWPWMATARGRIVHVNPSGAMQRRPRAAQARPVSGRSPHSSSTTRQPTRSSARELDSPASRSAIASTRARGSSVESRRQPPSNRSARQPTGRRTTAPRWRSRALRAVGGGAQRTVSDASVAVNGSGSPSNCACAPTAWTSRCRAPRSTTREIRSTPSRSTISSTVSRPRSCRVPQLSTRQPSRSVVKPSHRSSDTPGGGQPTDTAMQGLGADDRIRTAARGGTRTRQGSPSPRWHNQARRPAVSVHPGGTRTLYAIAGASGTARASVADVEASTDAM